MMGRAGAAILCTARELYGSARTEIGDPAGGFCRFLPLRAREAERRAVPRLRTPPDAVLRRGGTGEVKPVAVVLPEKHALRRRGSSRVPGRSRRRCVPPWGTTPGHDGR